MFKAFEGKKTYLAAAALALTALAANYGWLEEGAATLLEGLFGAGALAALRSALGKKK